MRLIYGLPLLLISQINVLAATIYDDFRGNDWKKSNNTSGKVMQQRFKLAMTDADGGPKWINVSKRFKVNLETDPYFIVKVAQLTNAGFAKISNPGTKEKKTVLKFRRNGVYFVDLKKKYNWSGVVTLEVSLYSSGQNSSITYNYIKFSDKPDKSEQAAIADGLKPTEKPKAFELVPLFNSCSYYVKSQKANDTVVYFRKKGDINWNQAFAPTWISEENMYRGSIVNLRENTIYEFKITVAGKALKQAEFKTWSSNIPVGKTIVLSERNFTGTLDISQQGTQDAWIKYTAAPGFVLRNQGKSPLIVLNKAKYILLENLTLEGGSSSAIKLDSCGSIRIVNCDISGWGIVGVQRFDIDGRFYYKDKDKLINYNGAIYLSKSRNTVIEKCYIHDPRIAANSWYYAHPAGPEALMVDSPVSTVVRFNDFIGSDSRRWNDAIEGTGNSKRNGGFNRDADIYGNMLTLANDDCVEIDGGQQNVRVFLNKMENALCGISIQGCMAGPSYVFRNLIVNLGEEFGNAGQGIKTSMSYAGKDAVSYIFNNTITGKCTALPMRKVIRLDARNNIFASRRGITNRNLRPAGETDYNLITEDKQKNEKNGVINVYPKFEDESAGLFKPKPECPSVGQGTVLNNFTASNNVSMGAFNPNENLVLPYRPMGVYLNKYQLNFIVKGNKAEPASARITATVKASLATGKFKVRINRADKWFDVSPRRGVFKVGEQVSFTVYLKPEMMRDRKSYHGVFLIRLENGLSRPVSIYAKTGVKQAMHPNPGNAFVQYIDAASTGKLPYKIVEDKNAATGKCVLLNDKNSSEYTFEVPRDGVYLICMRVRKGEMYARTISYAIDRQKSGKAYLTVKDDWNWSIAGATNNKMMRVKPHRLQKGSHSIKIKPESQFYLDQIAITDKPNIFEQR